MKKIEEIKDEIWRIWEILILAKECFHYSLYLHSPKTPKELDYVNKSQDLQFIRHILWRTAIIELSKLFSVSDKRDRFNINHFIKKLKKDGYFGGLLVKPSTIDKWEKEIEQNSHTISILLKYRDKVYAHTDPNKDEHLKHEMSFEQTERLMGFVENIVKEIYLTILNSEIDTDIIFNKDRFDLVKLLADGHERKSNEMYNLIKRK
jgi:hypothetical protein